VSKTKLPVIITVSGKARNGKDQFARDCKKIMEDDGYKVQIIHHADYLKWVCETYLGVPHDYKSEGSRTVWQYVGTDLFRTQDDLYWVRNVEENIRYLQPLSQVDFVIIPDCRFANEINYYKEKGYKVISIRVARKGYVSPLTKEQQNHISETALDFFTFDKNILAKDLTELNEYARIVCKEAERNG
jgi:hypothetical protein